MRKTLEKHRWSIAVLCLSMISFISCTSNISNTLSKIANTNTEEERDMDWYYKHNGYAIMRINDTRNQPVMEIIAIPLNSEALLALAQRDVKDVNYYIRKRIKRQRPVFYLSVYAYRDCIFAWPAFKITQAGGVAVPAQIMPSRSALLAAAGRLFERYGERRVREVDRYMGLFSNPYTGRDLFQLGTEIELTQGESLSAIAMFTGGIKLNRPFSLIWKSQRYVLSSGTVYTTREAKKIIRIFQPVGIE